MLVMEDIKIKRGVEGRWNCLSLEIAAFARTVGFGHIKGLRRGNVAFNDIMLKSYLKKGYAKLTARSG
jgi:hypothetical protein